jgi:hypothetical protein
LLTGQRLEAVSSRNINHWVYSNTLNGLAAGSFELFDELHVAGLAGLIIASLTSVPFHLDDAAIYFSDGTQIIATFARNTLSGLPFRPINLRFHASNLARSLKIGHSSIGPNAASSWDGALAFPPPALQFASRRIRAFERQASLSGAA